MKSWFCIPSARPVAEVIRVVEAWRERGYGVALQRDNEPGIAGDLTAGNPFGADWVWSVPYRGYADAVNTLSFHVLRNFSEVDWIVTGGDDTFPDPNKTGDEIAEEITGNLVGMQLDKLQKLMGGTIDYEKLRKMPPSEVRTCPGSTFGVMQPTGDRWADPLGVIIERIAGSPWLGREWCRRAHAGKGPFWPEFSHMFGDEALQLYAQSLGVFLQRPDLKHYHAHAQRDLDNPTRLGGDPRKQPPAHMKQWNSQKHWQESKAIFERLKSTNFSECQPIA